MAFKPATRKRVKARLALLAMSKCGKSYTALALMRGLVGSKGRIAAIDTENGALSLYSGRFPGEAQPEGFDVEELTLTTPDSYIRAITEAGRSKYDGLIIDSASHEWHSLLEMVDGQVDKFFTGWKAATPKHNAFIRAIVDAPMHVIVTVRQKDEYVVVDNKPKKVGLEAVQRKQFEYEFNAVMTLDLEHNIHVTHSAIEFLPNGTVIPPFPNEHAGIELGGHIGAWLSQGSEDWTPPRFKKAFYINGEEVVSNGIERETYLTLLNRGVAARKAGKNPKKILEEATGLTTLADLTEEQAQAALRALEA